MQISPIVPGASVTPVRGWIIFTSVCGSGRPAVSARSRGASLCRVTVIEQLDSVCAKVITNGMPRVASTRRTSSAGTGARLLGIWGHHDSAAAICRDALVRPGGPGPAADSLKAKLFANAFINAEATGEALGQAQSRLASPSPSSAWRVNNAMIAAATAQPPGDALGHVAPVLAEGLRDVPPDSLTAVYALLVLIWSGELATAGDICEAVLSAARRRGSMSMVAHASCLRSMIMRRLGRFDDAAADAALALDFKLATSPPLAVAWAAGLYIEPLARLGRFGEADAVAAAAADREPPPAGSTH